MIVVGLAYVCVWIEIETMTGMGSGARAAIGRRMMRERKYMRFL